MNPALVRAASGDKMSLPRPFLLGNYPGVRTRQVPSWFGPCGSMREADSPPGVAIEVRRCSHELPCTPVVLVRSLDRAASAVMPHRPHRRASRTFGAALSIAGSPCRLRGDRHDHTRVAHLAVRIWRSSSWLVSPRGWEPRGARVGGSAQPRATRAVSDLHEVQWRVEVAEHVRLDPCDVRRIGDRDDADDEMLEHPLGSRASPVVSIVFRPVWRRSISSHSITSERRNVDDFVLFEVVPGDLGVQRGGRAPDVERGRIDRPERLVRRSSAISSPCHA